MRVTLSNTFPLFLTLLRQFLNPLPKFPKILLHSPKTFRLSLRPKSILNTMALASTFFADYAL